MSELILVDDPDDDAPDDEPTKVPTSLGVVTYWGSDCRRCGNTNPGSMYCDKCGKDDETVALFALER